MSMERDGSSGPLTCPNGHAMDDGLFNCPACGVYRRPRSVRRNGTHIPHRHTRVCKEMAFQAYSVGREAVCVCGTRDGRPL